jgi:hypothetical protein
LKHIADKLDETSRQWRRQFEASMRSKPGTAPTPNPGLVVAFDHWLDNQVHAVTSPVTASHLSIRATNAQMASLVGFAALATLFALYARTA